MQYACDLGGGRQLLLRNDGGQTLVTFHSGGPGQQQRQSVGINTGEWSSKPAVFRTGESLLLKATSNAGESFFRVHENQISSVSSSPDLAGAEELPLREVTEDSSFRPMEPMKPMAPMSPMKPMEMQMGHMRMSMGSPEAEPPKTKYCTQCGNALQPQDRFCGNCGHKV